VKHVPLGQEWTNYSTNFSFQNHFCNLIKFSMKKNSKFNISFTLGLIFFQIIFIKSYSLRAFQQYQEHATPKFHYNLWSSNNERVGRFQLYLAGHQLLLLLISSALFSWVSFVAYINYSGLNIEHSSKLEAQKCSPSVYPQAQLWAKDMGLKCGAIGNILGEQIQNIIENT
jgi:hypothetical protein